MSVTHRLVDFVIGTEYGDLPEEVTEKAKRCILDCLGVTMAGSADQIAKGIKQYLSHVGGREQATVFGLNLRTSCTNAAFANSTLGHTLDYDDINWHGVTHTTVVVLPAVLSIGEMVRASGRDILNAFSIGYEIISKLGKGLVESGDHRKRGFHTTATLGVFGAAAATAKLLDLNRAEVTYALGIAGSQASGLNIMFGSATKPLQAGRAAESGVKAALLAQRGFTSTEQVIEGPSGYAEAFSDQRDLEKIAADIGKSWGILDPQKGVIFKMFPVWGGGSGSIDSVLSLVEEYDIDYDEVKSVECRRRDKSYGNIYPRVENALQAKFSMPFWVAVALLERKVSLEQFVDKKVLDPRIRLLMKKVAMSEDPNMAGGTNVTIALNDGRVYTRMVWPQKGAPDNPPSDEELIQKYRSCATVGGISKRRIDRSIELVMEFNKLRNVKKLIKLLVKT